MSPSSRSFFRFGLDFLRNRWRHSQLPDSGALFSKFGLPLHSTHAHVLQRVGLSLFQVNVLSNTKAISLTFNRRSADDLRSIGIKFCQRHKLFPIPDATLSCCDEYKCVEWWNA